MASLTPKLGIIDDAELEFNDHVSGWPGPASH